MLTVIVLIGVCIWAIYGQRIKKYRLGDTEFLIEDQDTIEIQAIAPRGPIFLRADAISG